MEKLILVIAISILFGIVASYYTSRIKFPTLTGLILIGVILSFVLNPTFISKQYQNFFSLTVELSASLLLLETGFESIYLRRDKKVLISGIIQSVISYVITFLLIKPIFKISSVEALVVSTAFMITGSDVAITFIKQLNILPIDKIKLGTLVVIDDLIAEIFFFLFLPLLKFKVSSTSHTEILLNASLEILLSIIIGLLIGYIFSKMLTHLPYVKPNITTGITILLFTVGISAMLNIHSIMVALLAGITMSRTNNLEITKKLRASLMEIDSILYTLFVVFAIVLVGIPEIEASLLYGTLALGARFIGKSLSLFVIQKLNLLGRLKFRDILTSLLPQSILSGYFAYTSCKYIFSIPGNKIFAITLASITIFEIAGYGLIRLSQTKQRL